MENFNIKLDRPTISSEEIKSRENFDQVLSKFNQVKMPAYKNPWFWGSAGLATVGLTTVISLSALTLKNEKNDKTITLKKDQLPPDTECVKPPVKDENIAYKTYQVNPLKDEKIVLESGTTIEIDKGSLQAQNLNEKVEIKVREFKDAASVFISGIPMDCQKDAFESAGMIEIKGVQNGQEVKINPEKPIDISLVTTKDPETFAFWKLNESKKDWDVYPATKSTNESIKESSTNSTQVAEVKKQNTETKKQIISLENEVKTIKKPTVVEYKIPTNTSQKFDLDFDKNDYPELASFKNVIFEVLSKNGNDPTFAANSKKIWTEIDLKKKNDQYIAYFKNQSESCSMQVRPILQGSELKKAEKEFDLALQNFQSKKTALEKKKATLNTEQLSNQARLDQLIKNQLIDQENRRASRDLVNQENNVNFNKINSEVTQFYATLSFQTAQWGFFNCDKQVKYPEPLKMGVALIWLGDHVAKFKQLFVFNKDKNLRYSYGEGYRDIQTLGFNKSDDLVLIGIDFEGNIGYAEITKAEQINDFKKIIFKRKEKETKTLDLLKTLLNETLDAA